MKEAIKKAISDALMEPVMFARENSVSTDEGRIFLDAAAIDYGAAVNMQGDIIDAKGKKMDENSKEYKDIVATAKKQARSESKIGGGLIGA
jgi:hypothetical protein